MNAQHLRYLRDSQRQLAASIAPNVTDPTASRLLFSIRHLFASIVAECEDDTSAAEALSDICTRQLPSLQTLFANDEDAAVSMLEEASRSGNAADMARAFARLAPRLLSRGDPASHRLIDLLIDYEADRWRRIDDAALKLANTAGEAAGRELEPFDAAERERLLALLRTQCGEGAELGVARIASLSGGFSKQTILVELCGNRVLPSKVVIRCDRPDSPAATTVLDEYELLRALHAARVAVPRPFAIDDGKVAGSPLMVVSHEPGRIIADAYDVFDRSQAPVIPTMARELAKLHAVPAASLSQPLPGHDAPHRVQLRNEIDGFRREWQKLDQASIVIETAFEWIYARCDKFDGERCITHRDLRFHNVLCDDSGVRAIIDWELAALGSPARDLGYLYHQVVQIGEWTAFLDAYARAGGSVPSAAELDFYIVWADLSVAIYMYLARANYLATAGDNILFAYAGERMRQHNLRILSERMRLFLRERR